MSCSFISCYPDYLLDRVILINDSHEHNISSYKLACASEYFKNIIKNLRLEELETYKKLINEKNTVKPTIKYCIEEIEKRKVKINYDDLLGIEFALSYVHTSDEKFDIAMQNNLRLTEENLQSVIKAGVHFKMLQLLDYCYHLLLKSLTTNNCWKYLNIIQDMSDQLPKFAEKIKSFILENFLDSVKSRDFIHSDISALLPILKSNELICTKEILILPLINSWISSNVPEREHYTLELIECLRLGRMKSEEIDQVWSSKFVQQNRSQFNRLIEWSIASGKWKQENSIATSEIPSGNIDSTLMYLELPRYPGEAIFVVGGWEGNQDDPNFGPSKAVQVYDCRTNLWQRYVTDSYALDEGHAYSGCVAYDNKIFVLGGYVSSGPTQTLKMFDFEKKSWQYLSPMNEKRNYVCGCLLHGYIYAIGGHNGKNRLHSVEKYDSRQNQWTFISAMNYVRSDAGAESLLGKIYVCGGFDGHQFYSSVEMFDPDTDQWTLVASMFSVRSGVSTISCGNYIFAIGGNNGQQRLRTVERYDPEANQWQTMKSMNRQRSNFCLATVENEIYAMGGWSDETNSTIALTEKWKPGLLNSWETVHELFMPASANCCCSVVGLNNIKDHLGR